MYIMDGNKHILWNGRVLYFQVLEWGYLSEIGSKTSLRLLCFFPPMHRYWNLFGEHTVVCLCKGLKTEPEATSIHAPVQMSQNFSSEEKKIKSFETIHFSALRCWHIHSQNRITRQISSAGIHRKIAVRKRLWDGCSWIGVFYPARRPFAGGCEAVVLYTVRQPCGGGRQTAVSR